MSLFERLKKTRDSLSTGLMAIFQSDSAVDESLFEDIEDQLIMADLGVSTTEKIVRQLRERWRKNNAGSTSQLYQCLREIIVQIMKQSMTQNTSISGWPPHTIIMIGVNGVGKTTTTAKIAYQIQLQGKRVMLAACDTFRAAAVDQLITWGERLQIPVIAQAQGADAAAVAFDALASATAKNIDVLIIDTAGRQHTHDGLMDQLKKIQRVLLKGNAHLSYEVYLTVDAISGQNVLSQIEKFNHVIPVNGICVTRLDGTAKGGVLVAMAEKFGIPIKYLGMGEKVGDLKPFDAEEYVSALLPGQD